MMVEQVDTALLSDLRAILMLAKLGCTVKLGY
jgi:hypothetical protein